MKIALLHNPAAGEGQDVHELEDLLTDAGHEVRPASSDDELNALLQDPGDLLVAAGGDGTVRRAILAAARSGVPFAVLPTGTANNIGKTLGLFGSARELVSSWASITSVQRYAIGEATGPWGTAPFVEAAGGGVFADLIGRSEEIDADAHLLGRETDRALHVLQQLVQEASADRWTIEADDDDLSGDYIGVEVLNGRFVGPNVPLAPMADPTDGSLELVLIADADRQPLEAYLDGRLRLAAGPLPHLPARQVQSVSFVAPDGVRLHLDDRAAAHAGEQVRIELAASAPMLAAHRYGTQNDV